ncbi:MAG: hypothetical protein WBV28_02580 [Terracidiphilus sp.]
MSDFYQQAYSAALAEASSELEKISGEIEELSLRKSRIEKAVSVLKGQIDFSVPMGITIVLKKSRRPNFYMQTRVRLKDEAGISAN